MAILDAKRENFLAHPDVKSHEPMILDGYIFQEAINEEKVEEMKRFLELLLDSTLSVDSRLEEITYYSTNDLNVLLIEHDTKLDPEIVEAILEELEITEHYGMD